MMFLFAWQACFKISATALHCLFQGIRLLSIYIGQLSKVESDMLQFALNLTTSLPSLCKCAGIQRDDFETKISCTKCDTIYNYEDGFGINSRGKKVSRRYGKVDFPNHRMASQRKPCGALLMKQIGSVDGKEFFYP